MMSEIPGPSIASGSADRSFESGNDVLLSSVDDLGRSVPDELLAPMSGEEFLVGLFVGLCAGLLVATMVGRVRTRDDDAVPTDRQPEHAGPVASFATPDGDSLTDEERIVQLLVERGGRMKQSQIVGETDWSKAKVSRLLSTMEANDEITKLTVGRENLIFLGAMDDIYISGRHTRP